jgi:hypothetical protein
MKDEYVSIRKEAVAKCLNALSRYSPEETEERHENASKGSYNSNRGPPEYNSTVKMRQLLPTSRGRNL